MNSRQHKLTQREQEERQTSPARQASRPQNALEFKNAEEALRHDREHTPVPATVAERLNQSIEDLPKPQRSWWRFWAGSGQT